jgi:flagellar motility protein MotE (MotC chaperone)
LRTLERELDEKLENLKALEVRMQKLIDSAGTIQDEKMAHLVDVYSNMKPKQAAQVLETLDEPIAVRILAGMSGRKAGEILSSVRAAGPRPCPRP